MSLKKFSKIIIANLFAVATIVSTITTPALAQTTTKSQDDSFAVGNTQNPKNIIFLVGDGMGPSFNTAYRYYKNAPNAKSMSSTAFDHYLKGTNRTYSNDPKENITDSAAGATAFSSGHKTYNGAIGVDSNKNKVTTVLEHAKAKGKSTGLVTTAEITDATPAAYASHVTSRDDKNKIAQQYFTDKINGKHKVDVLLGGGATYFGKNNGNLTQQFKKDGYDIVTNSKSLSQSKNNQVLGLFAQKNMPLDIDATKNTPSLAMMEQSALEKLDNNNKGFFLMVEGASIDKSAHVNDITGVMSEMQSFEKAFDEAIQYANKHKDTLVVATADHSTGGLTIGKDKDYVWNTQPIKEMKHSGSYMTEQIADGHNAKDVINKGYGIEFSNNQLKKVIAANQKLQQVKKKEKNSESTKVKKQLDKLQEAIQQPINDASHTGWTTHGYTGEDVNTYAFGPQADKFSGNLDNTDSAKIIFNILK